MHTTSVNILQYYLVLCDCIILVLLIAVLHTSILHIIIYTFLSEK